jgi:hypothetical protein
MEQPSKKKLSKKKLKKLEKQEKAASDIKSIRKLVKLANTQEGEERYENLKLAAILMLHLPTSLKYRPAFDEKTNKELIAIEHQILFSVEKI